MHLFDDMIRELHASFQDKSEKIKKYPFDKKDNWPASSRNIVMGKDTALELGSPEVQSVSFIMWTEDLCLVSENALYLKGPDIKKAGTGSIPYAKVVVVAGKAFTPENNYERYRRMEMARYDISIEGFMMRAVSQYMREWVRVSHQAVKNGLSLKTPANRLIEKLLEEQYIEKAAVYMITEKGPLVDTLYEAGQRAAQYIASMVKMTEEMSFDCDACEYLDVCSDADDLKSMRDYLKEKKNVS